MRPKRLFFGLEFVFWGISISINVKTEVRAAATKEKKNNHVCGAS